MGYAKDSMLCRNYLIEPRTGPGGCVVYLGQLCHNAARLTCYDIERGEMKFTFTGRPLKEQFASPWQGCLLYEMFKI